MPAMIMIHVAHVSPATALHHRYPGQTSAQPCHVELDCQDGELTADYNVEIGNAVPLVVWHGHVRRYSIPCLSADAANEVLDEIAPFAQRVLNGYSSRWDGNNHVADLDADAIDAEEQIRAIIVAIEDTDLSVWQAEDWFATVGGRDAQRAELGISAETTDEQITALAEREEALASADEIEGVQAYLISLRDEVRTRVQSDRVVDMKAARKGDPTP